MLQNILDLPVRDTAPVFASADEETVPVWAAEAYHALQDAGIELSFTDQDDMLTRKDAASALYRVKSLLEQEPISKLYWLE